ncbi:MAG: signal peptidase I [Planctomycetota bacterium]|nr:signal peptidase I [Planctomycetota bacterium]
MVESAKDPEPSAAPTGGIAALKKKYDEKEARKKEAGFDRVGAWKRLRPWSYVLLFFIIVYGIWPYTWYTMPENGLHMPPKYPPGCTVLVHTGFSSGETLQRGDPVVYEVGYKGRPIRMMSRVVGLPGDEVAVLDGRLVLNGEAVLEEYLSTASTGDARPGKGLVTVPEGGVYVLNDDRVHAVLDSRDFGPLEREQIVGKVLFPIVSP